MTETPDILMCDALNQSCILDQSSIIIDSFAVKIKTLEGSIIQCKCIIEQNIEGIKNILNIIAQGCDETQKKELCKDYFSLKTVVNDNSKILESLLSQLEESHQHAHAHTLLRQHLMSCFSS